MDQPGPKPKSVEGFPQIVEPPVSGSQAETPIPEPPMTDRIEDVVAPTPQKENPKPEAPAPETSKKVEPEVQIAVPETNIDRDQKATKLIDTELPSDQGLKPFAELGEEAADFTDPKK